MARNLLWCDHTTERPIAVMHWHFGIEFLFVRSGGAKVAVDTQEYELCGNNVLVVDRLHQHVTESVSGEYEQYCLLIQPEELHRSGFSTKMLFDLFDRYGEEAVVVDVSRFEKDFLRIFTFFCENWSRLNDEMVSEYCRCLTEELLILLHSCSTQKKPKKSSSDARIAAIKNEIDEKFAQEISVAEIAGKHFISEDHLIHEFRRVTGYSPWQYITTNRLVYSQELLSSTDDSVSVIAQKCGFSSPNSYIRAFKNKFGLTPGQYRRSRA